MEEGGRSRSSLSSNASSQRTLSADSNSSRRNSDNAIDHGPGDYVATWIKTSNQPVQEICRQITRFEKIIDDSQRKASMARDILKGCKDQHFAGETSSHYMNELNLTTEKIAKAEKEIQKLGPCPLLTCTRHHEPTNDYEMTEAGQYPLTKSPTPPINLSYDKIFKQVSPKKAARPQLGKSNPPIETSNRFQNLMDTTEINIINDKEIKISIPDINLKLSADYNLTIQEITRKFPETICKYNRG
ncbi:hypothetical protein AVEN_140637-1, partial [Araneus ventricosus]